MPSQHLDLANASLTDQSVLPCTLLGVTTPLQTEPPGTTAVGLLSFIFPAH